VDSAAHEGEAPAVQAAIRKISKYSVLSQSYPVQPIAVENINVHNSSAVIFFNVLDRRISLSSSEERDRLLSTHFYHHATFQRHSFAQLVNP